MAKQLIGLKFIYEKPESHEVSYYKDDIINKYQELNENSTDKEWVDCVLWDIWCADTLVTDKWVPGFLCQGIDEIVANFSEGRVRIKKIYKEN